MKGLQQEQNRRLKLLQPDNQQQLQQQQPQKCPRCESLNTKFCYYNNYSLSQSRYFCKTCRRYWTQGGILRNVPVGGGCLKGKPSKRSSSDDNQQTRPPPQQQPNSTITSPSLSSPATSIYYTNGRFLSSLAAIPSFNQPINVGGDSGVSDLGLLQGFSLSSFTPQQQLQHQELHSSRPSISQQEWNQSFINNTNSIASNAGDWNNNTGGSSLNPSQWPDLLRFDLPPSSSPASFS